MTLNAQWKQLKAHVEERLEKRKSFSVQCIALQGELGLKTSVELLIEIAEENTKPLPFRYEFYPRKGAIYRKVKFSRKAPKPAP